MELEEVSVESAAEWNVALMYKDIPNRELPRVPEWREMPITKGLPNQQGVQIRVVHRRLMAFRWRFRELRVKDYEEKKLPKDWHDWMECHGGEYGVYNCGCDMWDEPPKRRMNQKYTQRRDETGVEFKSTSSTEIVVDTVPRNIQPALNALELRTHKPDWRHSGARRHVSKSATGSHIEIGNLGLVHHDVLVAYDRAAERSHERDGRRAQHRLRVTMVSGGIRCGVHALR